MTKVMYDYYILEYHPDHTRAEGEGWVPQQIIIMEQHLGRELSPDEDVKHLNGNPHDNRVENLKVVSPQFSSKSNSLFDSPEIARKISKTFIPCRFQKECWRDIRAPIVRKYKIFLPYICSYSQEGDIYKCGHFWSFIEKEALKGESEIGEI